MTTHLLPILLTLIFCYVVPVLATFVLLWLNIYGYYIGGELSGRSGEDNWKLFGLQVAAVAFYLSILGSLWHMHSRIARPADGRDRSIGIVKLVTIPLVILFVTVVLLATATRAVIPDLRNWEAGGTIFRLNATLRDLWPSQLEKEMEPDRSCATAERVACFPSNIEFMGQLLSYWPRSDPPRNFMLEQVGISGREAVRKLEVRFRGPFDYQPPITSATIPSAQIADALSKLATYWSEANTHNCVEKKVNFCYYNDIQYAVKALQPVVFVRCNPNNIDNVLRFPRLDQGTGDFPLVDLNRAILTIPANNVSYPTLEWITLPEETFGSSSIGAVVSLPFDDQTHPNRLLVQSLACTIDARWANSVARISYLSGPMVVSGSPINWFTSGRLRTKPAWSQVKISLGWAQDIDSMSRLNTSVFTLLSSYLAANTTLSNIPYATNAVEAILAVMLAEGLSRTSSSAIMQGTLKGGFDSNDWINELLPKRGAFGGAGNAFDYPQGHDDIDTKLEMQATVNGYGYGSTWTRIPAIGALGSYLLVVTVYMAFFLWKRFQPLKGTSKKEILISSARH